MSGPHFDLLAGLEAGGCSAKLSATDLDAILDRLPKFAHPDLLVGTDTQDDAAVWKLDDQRALIFTTDFFPPLCSDPYTFGAIAATNALSDVYAMGGKPLLALNIVGFSKSRFPPEVYGEILRGGAEKISEAGALLAGGHTIDDHPPKYGLAVVGLGDPDRLMTNAGARPGDTLVLTKPLGTGIVTAAQKLGIAPPPSLAAALQQMTVLNRRAAAAAERAGVRGATDITGFGLLGHALKMARASRVTFRISLESLPLIDGVETLASDGCRPGAAFRNLEWCRPGLSSPKEFTGRRLILRDIACDPQTSGGLLLSVPPNGLEPLLEELLDHPETSRTTVIGTVEATDGPGGLFLE